MFCSHLRTEQSSNMSIDFYNIKSNIEIKRIRIGRSLFIFL